MSLIKPVEPGDFRWGAPNGPAAEMRRILDAANAEDDSRALNEQALLHLESHGLREATLWLGDGGFALLRGPVLDLVVHPDARGNRVGTSMAAAALASTSEVEAWSHCDHPAAARIAERFAIPRQRELRIMRRPLSALPAEPPVPEGVTIRTFRPGDEAALLEVNALAFAHHPDQGQLSAADFSQRMAQDWFDPAGLFLAMAGEGAEDRSGAVGVLGFHWTKVHREADPAYGEVYVVAVRPDAAGRGLGTLLTAVGVHHLAALGLAEVILYVEGDNAPAIAVYTRLGFEPIRTEVQYRGPTGARASSAR